MATSKIVDSGGRVIIPNEVLLDYHQLSNIQGILSAVVLTILANPVGGDTIILTNSVTTRTYSATAGGDIAYAIGATKEDTMANLAAAVLGDAAGAWNAYVCTSLTGIAATVVVLMARATAVAASSIYGTWATQANVKIASYATLRDYLSNALTTMPTAAPTISNFGIERTVAALLARETHVIRNEQGSHKEFYWNASLAQWVSTIIPAYKRVTDTYTILDTDDSVFCDKGSMCTITLPPALGSGYEKQIKNIGAGAVKLQGNGGDKIDGSAFQVMGTGSSVVVKDYAAGKWAII